MYHIVLYYLVEVQTFAASKLLSAIFADILLNAFSFAIFYCLRRTAEKALFEPY